MDGREINDPEAIPLAAIPEDAPPPPQPPPTDHSNAQGQPPESLPPPPPPRFGGANIGGVPPGPLGQDSYLAAKYRPFVGELRGRPQIILDFAFIEFWKTMKRKWIKVHLINAWFWTIIIPLLVFVLPILFIGETIEYVPEANLFFYLIVVPFALVFTSITAARYITSDLADKSIVLYLSRPMSKSDYLASRLLTSCMMLFLVLVLPNVILWIGQMGMTRQGAGYIISHLWTLGAILVQGMLYIMVFSLIGLVFSAATTRHRWAIVGVFVSVLVSLNLAEGFADMTGNDQFLMFSVLRSLHVIGSTLLGVDSGTDLGWGSALGSLFLIMAGCVAFILYRLGNEEAKM